MNDSLVNIDPELLATNVSNAFKIMHKSVKHFRQVPLVLRIVTIKVSGFSPDYPRPTVNGTKSL